MDATAVLMCVFSCVAAYFLGAVPFGFLLAKFITKTDIRAAGSGNIGATNVARVLGRKLGVATLILDAGKGALAVWMTTPLGTEVVAAAAGFCAVVGHCFPVWLRFRGGKGVATGLGVVLVLQTEAALLGLGVFIIAYVFSKKASMGSLLSSISVVVFLYEKNKVDDGFIFVLMMMLVVLYKHKENIKRLINKTELKV